jgi:hypothetical protein
VSGRTSEIAAQTALRRSPTGCFGSDLLCLGSGAKSFSTSEGSDGNTVDTAEPADEKSNANEPAGAAAEALAGALSAVAFASNWNGAAKVAGVREAPNWNDSAAAPAPNPTPTPAPEFPPLRLATTTFRDISAGTRRQRQELVRARSSGGHTLSRRRELDIAALYLVEGASGCDGARTSRGARPSTLHGGVRDAYDL